MTAGTELRQAREHAGLTVEEISERTKIQLCKIEALEHDDYARLPQGIYLDGIVRAYAHEVGIDPEPMVERVRLERGKLPGDWEIPFAAPIDLHGASEPHDVRVIDVPDEDDPLESFSAESDAAAVPVARQMDAVPHSSPVPERQRRSRAGVALPLLALLAAAGWGAYLYETTRRPTRASQDCSLVTI
jgi:transcriptional regulator with XRE-family HTH domain